MTQNWAAECHCAECRLFLVPQISHYAECHYAECRYDERHGSQSLPSTHFPKYLDIGHFHLKQIRRKPVRKSGRGT